MNVLVECLDRGTGTAFALTAERDNAGFCEGGCYAFRCISPGLELLIDDAPLPARPDGWAQWTPGFYAGRVAAEVVNPAGRTLASYALSVVPAQAKLDGDVYERMLDEVYRFDAALAVGTESTVFDAGASGRFSSSHVEYARLRSYLPALLSALEDLRRRPLSRLRHARATVGIREVRRIDARTVRRALQNPSTAAFVCAEAATATDATAARFDVSRSNTDHDHPANRLLAAMLQRLLRRIRQVADFLRALPDDTDQATRTHQYPRVQRRLDLLAQFENAVRRALARAPFSLLGRFEYTPAGLTAIASQPNYAWAYRLAWKATRPGIADAARDERLWCSPTWEIYERWCFLKMRDAVERVWPQLGLRMRSRGGDRIELAGRSDDLQVRLLLQKTFLAWDDAGSSDFRSVSRRRAPDIVLLVSRADRATFVVLDAKYSTRRENVLTAMASAHIYRDSLRWNGMPPRACVLLVPRGGGAPWLESETWIESNGSGVLALGTDADVDALERLVRRQAASAGIV
jgi:hypothetical protein